MSGPLSHVSEKLSAVFSNMKVVPCTWDVADGCKANRTMRRAPRLSWVGKVD